MPSETIIAPIGREDEAAVLALNNQHAAELSWLEPERLTRLIGQAFLTSRIGRLEAFLLAFDQAATYDSSNFLWFRDRYAPFVYVDRVAVAKQARGRGVARLLYEDLFRPRRPATTWWPARSTSSRATRRPMPSTPGSDLLRQVGPKSRAAGAPCATMSGACRGGPAACQRLRPANPEAL